jgi:hypothetical protein
MQRNPYWMNRQQLRLPLARLLAYGCIALPLSTIGLPLSIYLAPFYSGELGLPLALLGTAMVLARLVDVIVDPAIGVISDRWRLARARRMDALPARSRRRHRLFLPVDDDHVCRLHRDQIAL